MTQPIRPNRFGTTTTLNNQFRNINQGNTGFQNTNIVGNNNTVQNQLTLRNFHTLNFQPSRNNNFSMNQNVNTHSSSIRFLA